MIKLTLNPDTFPKTFLFDKDTIIIGEGPQEIVNLCLKNLGLHQTHLKITLRDLHFFISNQANDPFVTLNGLPFGKKKLKVNDIIQIKDQIIRVDEIFAPEKASLPLAELPVATDLSSKKEILTDNFPDIETLSKEDDQEGWFPSDLNNLNFEELTRPAFQAKTQHEIKLTLDDVYFEEDSTEKKNLQSNRSFWPLKGIKWVVTSFLLFLAIFSTISLEIYFRAKSQSGGEEVKAAESLADFAMALTYAQTYNIVPQKQNFSDPEFLKTNLIALLSSTSISCGNIDAQGQFSNCPYLLRFYSNQDLSHFLLIAQPAPSLSQWLFPKDAIVVDSTLMNLRKVSDMKTLNRLLANSNPFDGNNGTQLIEAIKQLKIISLPNLAQATQKKEFAPPSILAYIRPGAENLIYNAPRYYLFGETIVKKALSSFSQGQEVPYLVEIDRLLNLDHLVFYTTHGMQAAFEARQALSKLSPKNSFFTAYLQLSSHGEILGSRLVMDEEKKEVEEKPLIEIKEVEPIADAYNHEYQRAFEKLAKHKDCCKQGLVPIIQRMALILEEDLDKGGYELSSEFSKLLEKYYRLRAEQEKNLYELFNEVASLHPSLPLTTIQHLYETNSFHQVHYNPLRQVPFQEYIDPLSFFIKNPAPPYQSKN